jgi:hypothetical protein
MTTTPLDPEPAQPTDATEVFDWDGDGEAVVRFFVGTERQGVRVSGLQGFDGSVRRWISVVNATDLDAAGARALALLDAADRLAQAIRPQSP